MALHVTSYLLLFLIHNCLGQYLPVVLWHGMGDSCCSEGSLGRISKLIEAELPGITVMSLKFGNSVVGDIESGYFGDSNKMVDEACQKIAENPEFHNGYNAIGFSQGGQFLRAVAQRCPSPPMNNLISLGGQHQGVYGLPHCGQPEPVYCDYIRRMLNYGAYVGWIQNSLVQAQYWHDPLDEETFRRYSIFLADINNLKDEVNSSYVDNLRSLRNLVLVKFEGDKMVDPPESSWFGFYAPGQSKEIVSMEQTDVYTQDTIGLQAMNEQGQVQLLSVPGDHLQFSEDWFRDTIIQGYLQS